MIGREYDFQKKIEILREREKELRCLYNVEELIKKELAIPDFFLELVSRIPSGWQYPEVCKALVRFEEQEYKEEGWEPTEWFHSADIHVDQNRVGCVKVYYTQFRKMHKDSPFLPEEQKLLNIIADRTGYYVFRSRLQQTIAVIQKEESEPHQDHVAEILEPEHDEHWKWRMNMCERIAEKADMLRYGIKGIYVIGSTKTTEAGPASDIDLLIHTENNPKLKQELLAWLEGWSFCLAEVNYSRTGYKSDGLLDIHLITDDDIKNNTSFAVMLHSVDNSAKPLRTL